MYKLLVTSIETQIEHPTAIADPDTRPSYFVI